MNIIDVVQYVQAMRDPAGLPFYPLVFQFLMVLTFALHIMFVNFVVGGITLALWGRMSGDPKALRLSKALARASTVNLSIAIVLAVAPLLFVQVIYDPFWYTANTMSAVWAMAFLIAVTAAFYCLYLFYLGGKKESRNGNPFWLVLALAAAGLAGYIIHSLTMEQLLADQWQDLVVKGLDVDTSGTVLAGFSLPRILHFIIPSFAISGIFLMIYAWYFRGRSDYPEDYIDFAARLGGWLALWATVAQAAVGVWWLISLPSKFNFLSNPFFLAGATSGLVLLGLLVAAKSDPIKWAPRAMGMAFVTLFLMSYAREALRSLYAEKVGYSIFDYKLNVDWGSTILFLATFLGGLVVLAYPAVVAYHAGKSDAPLTEEPAEGLGKVAYALTIIWFVVVAGLGIFISMKNGTLF